MRLRRLPVRVLLPIALMALLAVLATLQYRWLGQVSEAERDRMRSTVSARASELAEDFDREITRLFILFQLGVSQDDTASALVSRSDVWHDTAKFPRMLSAVYVVSSVDADATLRKLNSQTRALEPAQWDGTLSKVRDQLSLSPSRGTGTFVIRISPLIVDDPLVVAVPLPKREQRLAGGLLDTRLVSDGGAYVLLVLDEAYLRTDVLPSLVRQHLRDNTTDYRVAIVSARNSGRTVYATDTAPVKPAEADVASSMLSLRFGLADRIVGPELRASVTATGGPPGAPLHEGRGATGERVTVFFEQRSTTTLAGAQQGSVRLTAVNPGGWQLLLKHRAGSLEAAVGQVRRRNLLMSFGTLALLAVSTGLVFVSARRAERLAGQQMDFVATVSHELRTPLAVIRSAGQNLADGVVHDAEQARRYGDLIEGEGRRLTDMIEQTLALAGLSGDRRPLAPQPLQPGEIIRDVIESPDIVAATAHVHVDLNIEADMPPVLADAMLLRRAVQNLVANAVKYGGDERWVGVAVESGGTGRAREVRISVSDRGPGIDSRDLPHLFEPFYRGREAVARQVQGNGLGLHLVKRIAEAHGGRVSVRSSAGHGATFTLHLPAHTGAGLEALAGAAPQHS